MVLGANGIKKENFEAKKTMEEYGFEIFLESKGYTQKSISSRMSRARKAEEILGYNLNKAASSDEVMRESLLIIKKYDNRQENYQNATRCYYEFKNGKTFPKL